MIRTRRLAFISWGLTSGLSFIAVAIILATRDVSVPASTWGFRGASEAFGLTCGTVGAIVAIRRPDNLNGWLFCAIGLLFSMQALVTEYLVAAALAVPGGLPYTAVLSWVLTWLWVLPLGLALIYLPLLFPTGSFLTRRWRAVAVLGVVAIMAFSGAAAFLPGPIQSATFLDNPLGASEIDLGSYVAGVVGPAAALFLVTIVLALASLVLRFRRAPNDARLQIKWFALAALIAGPTFVLHTILSVALASANAPKPVEVVGVVALMGLPTAAGMAILRYRLYDIDRIISRTISYVLITAVLVGAYALVVVIIQRPLGDVVGGNTVAVALSTLVVAALFQPLRRRIQAIVDRRFDRARIDADLTAAAFSERLRAEVDIDAVTADLRDTVHAAVKPVRLSVWLREAGQ